MSKPSVGDKADKKRAKQRAQKRGRRAEWLVRMYLRATGHRIIDANCKTPMGEIDIIARKGRQIAFVEVKARTDNATAAAAIGARQQGRIQRAATYFLMQNPALQSCDVRFDVALVSGVLKVQHITDAWRP